jgi:hypothetical protein
MLHRQSWAQWVVAVALLAGMVAACQAPKEVPEPLTPPPLTEREVAERAFRFVDWEHGNEAALPSLVRVLVVDELDRPVAGAEITCLDVATRTDASGHADCAVQADDEQWPIDVRAYKDALYGQERTAGNGALARVVLRRPVTSEGRVAGTLPLEGATVDAYGANWEARVKVIDGRYTLPAHPASRTYLRVLAGNPGYGVTPVVLGTAIAERGESVDLTVGAKGTIRLRAVDAGGDALISVRAWLDRYPVDLIDDDDGFHLALPAGEHVLILNDPRNRARHEVKFRVSPETTVDLGTLRLE